jgi:hypothetical protein
MQRHLHTEGQHIFGLENLKMAATTSCNATPPTQHFSAMSAYIWFGKFKRWPPLPLEHHATCTVNAQLSITNVQNIFGLENLKDGRHYDFQRRATCTTLVSVYLVWKI